MAGSKMFPAPKIYRCQSPRVTSCGDEGVVSEDVIRILRWGGYTVTVMWRGESFMGTQVPGQRALGFTWERIQEASQTRGSRKASQKSRFYAAERTNRKSCSMGREGADPKRSLVIELLSVCSLCGEWLVGGNREHANVGIDFWWPCLFPSQCG